MNNDQSIFQKSRMPLYLQVAKLMRQKIERQEWRFGEQIPTLDELEQEYQVSRITLRGALTQLENEGIVRRARGLGTFVAKDLSEQRWFKLATNFDDLVAATSTLKIQLLPITQDDLPPVPAFPFGEPVAAYKRLRRVHYHNSIPYCLIEIYLDQEIFAREPEAFVNTPIVPRLAALPGLEIAQARQVMHITVCDEDTAAHLDIGVGDPIADVCRTILDRSGRVIYYAHIQYPAQMIQLETDLLQGRSQPNKRGAKSAR